MNKQVFARENVRALSDKQFSFYVFVFTLVCICDLCVCFQKMTSSDFKDLLSLVTKTDVTEVDPTLKLLFGVPLLGYESLIRVLINKYADHSRYLSCQSLGESIRYVVGTFLCCFNYND